jgi:hypothetical protein
MNFIGLMHTVLETGHYMDAANPLDLIKISDILVLLAGV